VIAVAETIQASACALFFKVEETTRYLAVGAPALEDAAMDHRLYYRAFLVQMQIR
jgi:hypothetical protein